MGVTESGATQAHHRGFIWFLLLTAVLCGGLVMVVEVLGSRVVGPFYGVGLFVWTSLITVTLIALAAGYWIGGMLADRYSRADMLYGIIILAAVLVLLIPLIKAPVLLLCQPLGLRTGSFVSTLIIFGPPLLLLGCVSPYLIKIAAREMHNIGRTVGGFYALSTVGSVIGTVLTGFFLIPWLGVDSIFQWTGILLLSLGLVYFLLVRRIWYPLLLLILPWVLPANEPWQQKMQADGTVVRQVYDRQSYYGHIKVVDYSYQDIHIREMMIDGPIQGGIDMNSGLSIMPYSYALQFIPRALYPEGRRCLVMGLGAGLAPKWYQQQGVDTDVVDIDPVVVDVARDWFGWSSPRPVIVEDARFFINESQDSYDYIILDVFNGDVTPGHLVSREAFVTMARKMTPQGVLVLNHIGGLTRNRFGTDSVVRTLREVFDQVALYPVFDPQRQQVGNITIVAYQGPKRSLPQIDLAQRQIQPRVLQSMRSWFGREYPWPEDGPGIVLSDDYNPLDVFDIDFREESRKAIQKSTDPGLLTG